MEFLRSCPTKLQTVSRAYTNPQQVKQWKLLQRDLEAQ